MPVFGIMMLLASEELPSSAVRALDGKYWPGKDDDMQGMGQIGRN